MNLEAASGITYLKSVLKYNIPISPINMNDNVHALNHYLPCDYSIDIIIYRYKNLDKPFIFWDTIKV